MVKRQIVLDTETTGLYPEQGHRVIEIGCVEMVNRRPTGNNLHYYIQPEREVDREALAVHGISNAFLADKPRFAEIIDEFLKYIDNGELIIHNARFDLGFLDHELKLCGRSGRIADYAGHVDTLMLARNRFPGQRNSLDALCKRFGIDNSHRSLHGALLDAEILAEVYIHLTSEQKSLGILEGVSESSEDDGNGDIHVKPITVDSSRLKVVKASESELQSHSDYLKKLAAASGAELSW